MDSYIECVTAVVLMSTQKPNNSAHIYRWGNLRSFRRSLSLAVFRASIYCVITCDQQRDETIQIVPAVFLREFRQVFPLQGIIAQVGFLPVRVLK